MEVLAFCFMPDHVHLLLLAQKEADLTSFMRTFKQRTGHRCRRVLGSSGPFWKKSYYDHILRSEERLDSVAAYIWANPVRAGLVENADDYQFSGTSLPEMPNASYK
jgi:REP element-mobilizing transposase RayT